MTIDQLHSELNKIDSNQKDGLEKKEIEDFLTKEEDVKKLGDIMQSHFESESGVLQQFKESVGKICERILKKNNISINQGKILIFYMKHFYNEKSDKIGRKIVESAKKGTWYWEVRRDLLDRSGQQYTQDAQNFMDDFYAEVGGDFLESQQQEREKCFKILASKDRLSVEDIQWLQEYKDRKGSSWALLTQKDKDKIDDRLDLERCFKLLESKDRLSAEDIQWLQEYRKSGGNLTHKDKDKIDERLKLEKTDDEIIQQIGNETVNNPLGNLESIDSTLLTKKPNWGNLVRDIKDYEDVKKINPENISNYLELSDGMTEENKYYVVKNFQAIIGKHLCLHPGYKIGWGLNPGNLAVGPALKTVVSENKLLESAYNNLENLKNNKGKLSDQIKNIFVKNNHILFDFWIKDSLSKCNTDEEKGKKVYDIFSVASSINSTELQNFVQNNSFVDSLNKNYLEIKRNQKELELINMVKDVIIPANVASKIEKQGGGKITKTKILDRGQFLAYEKYYKKGMSNFDKLYEASKEFWQGKDNKTGFYENFRLPNNLSPQEYFDYWSKLIDMEDHIDDIRHSVVSQMRDLGWKRDSGDGGVDSQIAGLGKGMLMDIDKSHLSAARDFVRIWMKSKGPYRPDNFMGIPLKWNDHNGKPRSNVDEIVRDTFFEGLSDKWDDFKKNLGKDRSKTVGDITGIVGGALAALAVSATGGGAVLSGVAFEAVSRLTNGGVQEIWNTGERALSKVGAFEDNGNNRVDNPGESFLLGVGLMKRDKNGIPQPVPFKEFATDLLFDTASSVMSFKLLKLNNLKLFKDSFIFSGIDNFVSQPSFNVLKSGTQAGLGIGEYKDYSVLSAMGMQASMEFSTGGITQKLVSTVAIGSIIGGLGNLAYRVGRKYFKGVDFNFVGELNKAGENLRTYLKNRGFYLEGGYLYNNTGDLVESITDDMLSKLYEGYANNLKQGCKMMSVVLASPLVTYNLLSEEASPQTILKRRIIAIGDRLKKTSNSSERNRYGQLLARYQGLQKWLEEKDDSYNSDVSLENMDDIHEIPGQIVEEDINGDLGSRDNDIVGNNSQELSV